MQSVWSAAADMPRFRPLDKDIKTDVLIIGGGLAGILCAYMLDRRGVRYVLAERGRICGMTTKNTTAKITSQHGLIYAGLIRRFGIERAGLYLDANETAVKEYQKLCEGIDCDFEMQDSYVYSLSSRAKIENELSALHRLGYPAEFSDASALPFSVRGAVRFKGQAQFNPLKFTAHISKNLNIYEDTAVTELCGRTAVTNHGRIKADKIIAATHFPFINKHGSYFLKLYQNRSYVIGVKNTPNLHGMYIDESGKGFSFRNFDGLLLLGGCAHRTGKRGGGWQELEASAKLYYPGAETAFRWAAQDCMSLDGIPYIGEYSKGTADFYVASGFNKWGITSSMAAAMILTDMVMGRKNKYAEIFSPSRTMLRPQLAANALEAVINLLTFSKRRCPHMGCALKWNSTEHSWDCPCHGSRFEEDGQMIDNPANGDLKNKGGDHIG